MGLDCYFMKAPDKYNDDIIDGLHSYFRGKAWRSEIEGITGVSLLQNWIGNDDVKKMAEAIAKFRLNVGKSMLVARKARRKWAMINYDMAWSELRYLHRMFSAYAKAGYGLQNSW